MNRMVGYDIFVHQRSVHIQNGDSFPSHRIQFFAHRQKGRIVGVVRTVTHNVTIDFDRRIVDFTSGQSVAQRDVSSRMANVIEVCAAARCATTFLLQQNGCDDVFQEQLWKSK